MNQTHQPDHKIASRGHLEAALRLARELSKTRQCRGNSHAWAARAHHVGDLAVLALALRE